MKWADNKRSIVKLLAEFFKLGDLTELEEIANSLSVGDNTLELLTLRLIQDKMEHNKYFVLTPQTYHQCKEQCRSLVSSTGRHHNIEK